MDKIVRLSRLVNILVIVLAAIHISISLVGAFGGFDAYQSGDNSHWILSWLSFSFISGDTSISNQFTNAGLDALMWMTLPSVIFYSFIYWIIYRLFCEYQAQRIFSEKACNLIKSIGTTLLVWPIFNLFYYPVLLVVLRLSGQLEEVSITLDFGSDDLMQIGAALIVIVVAWIMKEASKLQQEQELTI